MSDNKQRWYLGKIKSTEERIYLQDFAWTCGWYWSGGWLGNRNLHCHFDGAFLGVLDTCGHILGNFIAPWQENPGGKAVVILNGCAVWEPLSTFLDDAQYDERQWWAIKDIFKQFYSFRGAAECAFTGGRINPTLPRNPELAKTLNDYIEQVIIPKARQLLNKE